MVATNRRDLRHLVKRKIKLLVATFLARKNGYPPVSPQEFKIEGGNIRFNAQSACRLHYATRMGMGETARFVLSIRLRLG